MVGAKTGVATRMNEIESHAHLTHYHGHALETIKAKKIIRASFEFNTQLLSSIHFKYSLKRQKSSNRFREDTAPRNTGDRTLCSKRWTFRGTLLQGTLNN